MKGWGRVTVVNKVTLSLEMPGSSIPPGYELRLSVEDYQNVKVGDLVEYEIVPTPTKEAAELRRLYPAEPQVGGIH
jgi:hypothetical protein